MLRVSEVDVYYDEFQALFNVSLNVNAGEIVAIIGANGAGKTTLLALAQMWNLLAGYAGMVSVGQQAWIGLGGYALIVFADDLGLNMFLAVIAAGVVAALLSPNSMDRFPSARRLFCYWYLGCGRGIPSIRGRVVRIPCWMSSARKL